MKETNREDGIPLLHLGFWCLFFQACYGGAQVDSEVAQLFKKNLYFLKYEDYMQQTVQLSSHTGLMSVL